MQTCTYTHRHINTLSLVSYKTLQESFLRLTAFGMKKARENRKYTPKYTTNTQTHTLSLSLSLCIVSYKTLVQERIPRLTVLA
jgi:hypothetical protein